jgi:hypothetical protein
MSISIAQGVEPDGAGLSADMCFCNMNRVREPKENLRFLQLPGNHFCFMQPVFKIIGFQFLA